MSRRSLPQARALALPSGLSFDIPAASLSRWNGAVVAKKGEDDETDNTISIYDVIGFDYWTGEGTTAKRIAAALRSIGKRDVVVNINSPGGDLIEGLAIYNLLRDHDGEVTTRIVGLAASAASVIAMAGDKIQAARASFVMIHNAWVIAMGNRNDLRDVADQLEPFDDALADVYSARTGMEKPKVAKLMDKETWFSGSQAIEQGFADELLPADQIEEKQGEGAEAHASLRAIDAVMARHGIPRAQRRQLFARIKETQDPASAPGAAPGATQDAGSEVVAGLTDFFTRQAQLQSSEGAQK